MKLCIAGYNNRVATLCEHAQELLFYEFQDARIREAGSFSVPPGGPSQWTGLLREQGTQLLICGGICRHTQRLLGSAEIDVAPWICGSVDAVLDAFVRDALSECSMPGTPQRLGGKTGQGGQELCPVRKEGHGPRSCRGRGGSGRGLLGKGSGGIKKQ